MDLIGAALDFIRGGRSEPIDWDAKRIADEQRVTRIRALGCKPLPASKERNRPTAP